MAELQKGQDLELSRATLKKKNRGIRLGLKTEGMDKSIYNEQLDQQVILLTQSKAISPEVYFLVRLKQRTRRILD